MKKTITLSATILTLVLATAASAKPPWMGYGTSQEGRLDHKIERMTEQLGLTPEQQAEVRAIFEARRAQRDAERKAVREQVDAVLTEEQRAARDAQIEQRIERRVARMADRLDLTPEQETSLRALMNEQRNSPDLTRSEMRERMSAVLTDDQLAELEKKRPHHGRGDRGGCKRL